MLTRLHKHILLFLVLVLFIVSKNYSQPNNKEQHINVSLRMIGHKILLSIGDSTTRVLPIKNIDGRYKIHFASEIAFNPEKFVDIINRIVFETRIADKYIVEFEQCETKAIVYSYEYGRESYPEIIPCRTRPLPKDCYNLFFTILEDKIIIEDTLITKIEEKDNSKYYIVLIALINIFLASYFFRKKILNFKNKPEVLNIGQYNFNKHNMMLSYNSNEIELTSKEADLLILFHKSANKVLEREFILKEVWGDEGDYVGRTLDVFISKLRKKLELDAKIKIINVRGVGYKFVLENK